MVGLMKYYVVSKFGMYVVDCSISFIQKQRKYYLWMTPFSTLKEAEEHKKYIEKNSRALEVTIEEK
jgi:hypothetical protein